MLHFTTNQGFEDIVINELQSFFAAEGLTPGDFEASPFGIRGNVFYRPPSSDTAESHVAGLPEGAVYRPGSVDRRNVSRQFSYEMQPAREEKLLPFIPRMRSIYHCDRYLDHGLAGGLILGAILLLLIVGGEYLWKLQKG